jgi:hypothetical protein
VRGYEGNGMANTDKIKNNKKLPLSQDQVRAIIRLKAYEYYLERIEGEKSVAAFDVWYAKQKISQVLK